MSDIGREVPEDERRLWRLVKQEYEHNDLDPLRDTIRVTHLAQHHGIHEDRARQFARTWANDGLVVLPSPQNANYIRLTNVGERTDLGDP